MRYQSSFLLLLVFLPLLVCRHQATTIKGAVRGTSDLQPERRAIEIIIGGGGSGGGSPALAPEPSNCPPPPQPPLVCLPPPPPPPPPLVCPPPPPPPRPPPPPPPPVYPPPPPPPPPPPSPPPPPPPLSPRVLLAYGPVQRFKQRITMNKKCDPKNVTRTWNGFNVCNYKGFFCANVPKYNLKGVFAADFNGFGFCNEKKQLTLDGFIEELPDLVYLHANSNNISGLIPSKVSLLQFFYELDLSNNKLTGTFPTSVLGATKLVFLDLRYNSLVGPLPPQVFTLDLLALFLNNNYFIGEIPEAIGQSPVSYLTLAFNQFTGPIPRSIGQASNTLVEALFIGNKLSGCLPYEIGLLKESTVLDFSINRLTGEIPHSFGCLTEIRLLNLSFNQFYGAVPESVCSLPKLITLSLNDNYFTQVGPKCRRLIEQGKLNVNKNCIIDLSSQKSEEECEEFFSEVKPCPDESSFTYVPCKISESASGNETETPPTYETVQEMAPSPTYAALNRNRT